MRTIHWIVLAPQMGGVKRVQRYFIKSEQLVDDQAVIVGNDVHHIRDVMRGSGGVRFILCTCDQKSYLVEITHLSRLEVKVRVVETKEENVELPISVTIAHGITKGDKFDSVVQKATECGASEFIPVAMKRSVARIDESKTDKKVLRWQKIALEAARSAHRQVVPTVRIPATIVELVAMASEYDVCVFAYEAVDTDGKHGLAAAISKLRPGMRVLVLVGPEGGIDEGEVRILTEAGFRAVGLGPRILRTETAPIYVLAAMSYALEIDAKE